MSYEALANGTLYELRIAAGDDAEAELIWPEMSPDMIADVIRTQLAKWTVRGGGGRFEVAIAQVREK